METRIFSGQDTAAIEKAKTMCALASQHLAALAAFDAGLDAAFILQWQQAINAAENVPNDETTVDQQMQLTTRVDQCHEQCIMAVNDLRYYAGKSFSKDSEEMALFNFKGLVKARVAVSRLVVYLKVLHIAATNQAAQLTVNGMTLIQIDALRDTANALLQADVDQEYHKHYRLMLTRRRIATLNKMWDLCRQVHQASRSAFRDSPAKQSMFDLG